MESDDPKETLLLKSFRDIASAEVAKAVLCAEGVSAMVIPSDPIAAPLGGFAAGIGLYVHAGDRDRATAILRERSPTSAELASLATQGEFESDVVDKLAREWEHRFPDLAGEWTHWWIEGEGALLAVVPGTELSAALRVVRENHQRFASIIAHRARLTVDDQPVRQDTRFVITDRRYDGQRVESEL